MEIETTAVYDRWFGKLKNRAAKNVIKARLNRIATTGNFGDVRALGDGVSEIKIDYGPGYRIYYTIRGSEVVILLVGADKSRQEEDIRQAREMAKNMRKEWKNV